MGIGVREGLVVVCEGRVFWFRWNTEAARALHGTAFQVAGWGSWGRHSVYWLGKVEGGAGIRFAGGLLGGHVKVRLKILSCYLFT